MAPTAPSYAVTAALVIIFALLFASAFVAVYLYLRRRRLAKNHTPLPTHSPNPDEEHPKTRTWRPTLGLWTRRAPRRSFMYGLHSSIDERRMESMFRKNDEWLNRIKCMVEEAKSSPASHYSPKHIFSLRCSPKLEGRQRSNSSVSRPSLLDAWDNITSRCSTRNRSLSEASGLAPRKADDNSPVPPLPTLRMSHNWELEQARLTERMLASGVPMPWTPYVPPEPIVALTNPVVP